MSRVRVLYADPPWAFGDKLPGPKRGAAKHYAVLGDGKGNVESLCNFPLPELADDALCFMWRVSSQGEEAYRVMRAWGFVPKSEIVWIKTRPDRCDTDGLEASIRLAFGMGRYVRLAHEVCLIGARGRAQTLIRSRSVPSLLFAPRGEHSEKPRAMYDLIERLAPGPYCELFCRRARPGWESYGNQLQGCPAAPSLSEREKELRVIRDILSLVDVEVPLTVLRSKRVPDLGRAAAWAGRAHLRASDNVVRVPPRPPWLEPFANASMRRRAAKERRGEPLTIWD